MAEAEETQSPKNTVTIEEAGPCKKRLVIEIPQDAIRAAMDEQYSTLRREAMVPGFRRGRAPRRLLEKRFGKETADQVKLKLLADASDSALKERKLAILGDPEVDYEHIELPAEGPMKFQFDVEVWPEFELPSLEGIAVTKTKSQVTDSQVDTELTQLRKLSGIWTPRPEGQACQADDQVIANVSLKIEGVEAAEQLSSTEIYVRPHGFVEAIPVEKLDEWLVNVKPGDSKDLLVEVPKTYFRPEYRGKKVDIHLDVKEIKFLQPADLDEGFVKRYGADTEDQLRQKLRQVLEHRLETQIRSDMESQITRYLLENATFDLPVDVVGQQATTVLQRQYVKLLAQGLSRQQIEEHMETLRASSEEQAKEQLKTFFVIDKVCDKLGIEVTEEEVNGHIAQLAIQRGQRPERLKEQMERDGSLAQFRLEVRQSQCLSKLLESAKITEKEAPAASAEPEEPEKKKGTAKKAGKKSSKKET
jgi:trigger factor